MIRMISASNWMAMIFSLFGGHAHDASRWKAGTAGCIFPKLAKLKRSGLVILSREP